MFISVVVQGKWLMFVTFVVVAVVVVGRGEELAFILVLVCAVVKV